MPVAVFCLVRARTDTEFRKLDLIPEVNDMLLLPRALLTCVFFLFFCGVIDALIFLAGYFGRIGMIGLGGWRLWFFGGLVWYLSFYCALKVYGAYWRSQLPPQFRH